MVWLSIAYRHFSFKAINNLSNLSKCVRLYTGYAHRDSRERQNNRPVTGSIMFYPIYVPSMMAMDIPVLNQSHSLNSPVYTSVYQTKADIVFWAIQTA